MNLKGLLVAVALIGSASAIGCNPAAPSTSEDSADTTAATQDEGAAPEATNFVTWARTTFWNRPVVARGYEPYSVRFAPPALRYERIGVAPSARHFWVGGRWGWNGARYNWIGGHWDVRRAGQTFVAGHWDHVNGLWRYQPGYFR